MNYNDEVENFNNLQNCLFNGFYMNLEAGSYQIFRSRVPKFAYYSNHNLYTFLFKLKFL